MKTIDSRRITELKHWPSYDLVSDTPEFGKMMDQLENKYRKEHDKVAKLIKGYGIDPS
jgi:hypothetical protein